MTSDFESQLARDIAGMDSRFSREMGGFNAKLDSIHAMLLTDKKARDNDSDKIWTKLNVHGEKINNIYIKLTLLGMGTGGGAAAVFLGVANLIKSFNL